jgi:uncharacterized membrane protein
MKKITTIIITLFMFLSISAQSVSAENFNKIELNTASSIITEKIDNIINSKLEPLLLSMMQDPSSYGFKDAEISECYIGLPFFITNIQNENKNASNNIIYFPMINNKTIVGIVTLVKCDNEYSITVGKDFSKNLNTFIKSSKGVVTLVSTGGNIIGVDSQGEISYSSIFDDNNTKGISDSELALATQKIANNNNSFTKDSITACFFQPDNKKKTTENNSKSRINADYNRLEHYPLFQGSDGECWAAAVASMVEYEKGYCSKGEVYDSIRMTYGKGAQTPDVVDALTNLLGNPYRPTSYNRKMYNNEIREIIDNDDPACMLAVANDNIGHATALCGYHLTSYNYNSENWICFLEPHYECIRTTTITSSNITYSIDGYVFKWSETVRLMYN